MAKVDVQDASQDNVAAVTPEESGAPAPAPVAQPTTGQTSKKINLKSVNISRRTAVEALLVVAVIAVGVWAFALYRDNQDLNDKLAKVQADPQIAVQQQTNELIAKVRALYDGIPTDETPTIAQVSDAAKAKKQSAFFANAQNGDKVLMYVKAGQAILYRPSTNKIILIAPLTFSKNKTSGTEKSTSNTTTTNTETSGNTAGN